MSLTAETVRVVVTASCCRTLTFKIAQSAAGVSGAQIQLSLATFAADGVKSQNCTLDGAPAGSSTCALTFDATLDLRCFTAVATSPGDLAAAQGLFLCKASR